MILYACPKCGKWADVSFGQYLKDTWNKAFAGQPDRQMPLTYPCESGCGLMMQVQPTDRIFVRNKQSLSMASADDYGDSLLRTYDIVGITPLEDQPPHPAQNLLSDEQEAFTRKELSE